MFLAIVALMSTVGIQGPIGTPPAPPAPGTVPNNPSNGQRIVEAASLGRLIYTFDRAAWVSSDAFWSALSVLFTDGL